MDALDLKGRKVTIMGLGQFEHGSGYAAAKFAIDQGANLIITDLKSEVDLAHQITRVKEHAAGVGHRVSIEWVMGEHRDELFTKTDLIIRNPGVPIESPYLQAARKAGIPVESEMTLFFKLCPAKIVGITGTRGKSTTTSLVSHLLQKGKAKLWWGGNIGKRSPLEFLSEVKKDHVVVLELSSWMLESLHEHKLSPQVAVLLNVQEDHLNRYKDMDHYAQAKEYITMHQKPEDTLICNHGNAYTRAMGERTLAKVLWFSRLASLPEGYSLDGTMAVERLGGKEAKIAEMRSVPLRGEHNYENILAAIACARYFGIEPETIAQELAMFASLPGRLQFIDEIKGVTFVNDTTATTPSAGLAALSALKDRPIILVAGGSDKQLDFTSLASALPSMVKAVVWLPGTGTERFKAALPTGTRLNQVEAATMQEALKQAFALAQSGDIVLLSPSCASFGLFKNEFDRGDQFNAAIAALAAVMR